MLPAAEEIDSYVEGDAAVAEYNVDEALGERHNCANKLAKRYLELGHKITHLMAWEV